MDPMFFKEILKDFFENSGRADEHTQKTNRDKQPRWCRDVTGLSR